MTQIESFSYDADEVQIKWTNGSESRLAAIWLRDHCQMPESRDSKSGQRLMNITDIPPGLAISRVEINDHQVTIDYLPDQHKSTFSSEWLYQNCYCRNQPFDDRGEQSKILWQGDSFGQAIPRCNYTHFASSAEAKLAALKAVRDYGFVLLDSVPCESGQVLEVIEDFGFIRKTNYGDLFEVKAQPDATNLAFTNLGLGCHLDNPYRDPVPGLQLLHCLQSSTAGGESILQDGFMAASRLRAENPDHFSLLSGEWINFRFTDTTADLRSRVPFIEINDRGEIIKVRFNNRSIDTIKLPADLIRPFYQAYRHYAEILEREELQINFKLRPGELILFDNTRVLHARKSYQAGGTRHLQGAYSDLDGLYSCLRKLETDS